MNKITITNRSVLRVLLGVYLLPLYLVVFSLSVPPGDLLLCGLMFILAGVGYVLARRGSRAWRLIWFSALLLSLLCAVFQFVACQRIARPRSHHESILANPARAADALVGFAVDSDRAAR